MSKTYTTSVTREWEQARRAAFVQDVLATFTQRPTDLLPFEEVRQKLQLGNVRYLGLQDIPLDHIVGSVGRYQDFTRAFSPGGTISKIGGSAVTGWSPPALTCPPSNSTKSARVTSSAMATIASRWRASTISPPSGPTSGNVKPPSL